MSHPGNRFVAPGRQNAASAATTIPTVVASQRRNLKRKLDTTEAAMDATSNQTLIMFQGRDESYPDELNKLIMPLSCHLCKSQMTSMKSARDHYESKAHDRHISAWLAKNYTDVGLQTPPVKRMVKQHGTTGPNAYHCELCDLPLTSLTHARQHYAGRKHQLVEQKRSRPSGAGYYSQEGKWVRTGSRPEAFVDDGRFRIGEQFLTQAAAAAATPDSTTPEEPKAIEVVQSSSSSKAGETVAATDMDATLSCRICQISVTSASQIKMHMDGAKHQKNLRKQLQEEEQPSEEMKQSTTSATSIDIPLLAGDVDLAMYRTPSNSYYCKMCNKAMNHISILQQHLLGKKHLKASRQYVAS
ncbi:zinc finger matrin-type protein 3 [Drosophila sulfurigaster albostrigata]|uniref:zinc finger matrin-type protein 3 n=1 Tax=Drosophila sulfurigaster albostrigata TaxID=89887 RepID=UPI002D21B5D1|nr:zinc finger matrin-type protein 3 [Drosophila sulfurigaster albostrigata]